MLSVQENMELCQVGPGTRMGELMRRYWHPIAGLSEFTTQSPTKPIRLLGEDLVLYKDLSGNFGLIEKSCAHRRVNMEYGIPEPNGLRCPYHGWMYDETGRCIEQPFEDTTHGQDNFRDKCALTAYPVEPLAGLLWAYLGPRPAPLVPRWETLVHEHAFRQVNFIVLPCNWLQCQENSLDPVHIEWLHAYYGNYIMRRKGAPEEMLRGNPPHVKIGFDVFDHGVIKRRVLKGGDETFTEWAAGHAALFPNILNGNQWRVPMDDTHTLHVEFISRSLPANVPAVPEEEIEVYYPPLVDEKGKALVDYGFGQDYMAWWNQGEILERNKEKLGESDTGLILWRRLLQDQMRLVEDGGDPMNTFRDPATNLRIELPGEGKGVAQGLKSVRAMNNVVRPEQQATTDPTAPLPEWVNPNSWAGIGARNYLVGLKSKGVELPPDLKLGRGGGD